MKFTKCPNCGSNVNHKEEKCQYCGTSFQKDFDLKESLANSVENLTETAKDFGKPLAWGIGLSFLIPAILGVVAVIVFIITIIVMMSNFGM